jgi:hypothetical protein
MKNKFYYYFIIFFALFVIIQSITGTLMFFSKIGYKPSQWMEYYYGSEEMLKYFPQEPDRFKEPLTFSGRLKVLYSHTLAYGVLIFALSHLIRSLNLNYMNKNKIEAIIILFFVVAILEISIDIFLTLINQFKLFFLYIRFMIFIIFIFFMIFHSFLLIYLSYKQLKEKEDELSYLQS